MHHTISREHLSQRFSSCRVPHCLCDMTFGKGQRQPKKKRAGPYGQKRQSQSKKSRKQAYEQVHLEKARTNETTQDEVEAVNGDFVNSVVNGDVNELPEPAEPRQESSSESDESDEDDNEEEVSIIGDKRRLTLAERESFGMDYVNQEELRVAIKVSYIREFNSPPESDWKSVISLLHYRWGASRKVIKGVFKGCRDGDRNAVKKQKGGGCKHKLPEDNEGLIAGAAALNGSASPSMATEICNAVNKATYPDQDLKICHNTFMLMLCAYTDFEDVAILR